MSEHECVLDALRNHHQGHSEMTTPTAPLTTAAEIYRRIYGFRVPIDEMVMREIEAVLTTYAAQVRRDTIQECARLADGVYQEQPKPIHRSAQIAASRIRALADAPAGEPTPQLDITMTVFRCPACDEALAHNSFSNQLEVHRPGIAVSRDA